MNFTNINDPAGVTALLEKLRSSQAWADLQAQANEPQPAVVSEPPIQKQNHEREPRLTESNNAESSDTVSNVGPSVASLLYQLSSGGQPFEPSQSNPHQSHSSTSIFHTTSDSRMSEPSTSTRPKKDVRNFTFQQSLPYLAQLSEDPAFLETIAKLRKDQETLERRLWEEREAIREKQEEKVKVAVTKANMLNSGISAREAENMKTDFARELEKFDKEQVLPAWDDLITKQQAALEKLGVPTMFVTDSASDKEKQQRIISVIDGITGSGG